MMSRSSSPFTRADEKELFKDGIDPNFLDSFRSFYTGGNSTESCSVDITIDLNHATVDDIESCETTEALISVQASSDRCTTTLKVPDNIRKVALMCREDESSARNSEETFLNKLADRIISFQLQKIFKENPNEYKCATCGKTPVMAVTMLRTAVDDTTWILHLFHCFPVCDSNKCKLIATKCMEKMVKTVGSATGWKLYSISEAYTKCANCG
jgi:hypothetical protein